MPYLRLALLRAIRQPAYFAVSLVTLSLGIGVSTAAFAVLEALYLRPLPYHQPDRLVNLWSGRAQDGANAMVVSIPDFLDWRERCQAFAGMAIFNIALGRLAEGEAPEQIGGAVVSVDFFSVLGVSAALGRTFLPDEGVAGGAPVVVLTDSLWRRRFNADPSIVGKPIRLQGKLRTVVGVLPTSYRHPEPFFLDKEAEFFSPLVLDPVARPRASRSFRVIARLQPRVGLRAAQRDLQEVVRQLAQLYPETNRSLEANVIGLRSQLTRDSRPFLFVGLGTLACVLVIALTNVLGLQLARAVAGQGDRTLRLALGATRKELVGHAVAEAGVLVLCGSLLGVLAAQAIVQALVASAPFDLMRLNSVRLDALALGFAIVVACAFGAALGLLPLLGAADLRAASRLRLAIGAFPAGGGARESRGRAALVVAEVALTLPLVILAVSLARGSVRAAAVEPGFRVENVLSFRLQMESGRFEGALEELKGLPGVVGASLTSCLPFTRLNDQMRAFVPVGSPEPGIQGSAHYRSVGSKYFDVMGIPLLQGRDFSPSWVVSTEAEVIVNEAFARRQWPDQVAVGRRLKLGAEGDQAQTGTVIGVVGSVRHFGPYREAEPEYFVRHVEDPWNAMAVVLRLNAEPSVVIRDVRRALKSLDPELPIEDPRTMAERFAALNAVPHFQSRAAAGFAALSLLLTVSGVFGLISQWAGQRRHDFAIRAALGATPSSLLRMALAKGARLGAWGVGLGLVLSLAAGPSASRVLEGFELGGPGIVAAAAVSVLMIVVLATLLPARSAGGVAPNEILRR